MVWSENESVIKAIYESQEFLAQNHARAVAWHVRNWVDQPKTPLESPIEAMFSIWWVAVQLSCAIEPLFLLNQEPVVFTIDGVPKSYRLDFVVKPGEPLFKHLGESLGLPVRVAIELDGHEFHERTKEQVATRNQRDRDLQRQGWHIFHVSGSELHRDPATCVQATYQGAQEQLWKSRQAIVKQLTGKAIEPF